MQLETLKKLIVFNQVSLDGYVVDASDDMSWAHKQDAEWNAFAQENASGVGVFGDWFIPSATPGII